MSEVHKKDDNRVITVNFTSKQGEPAEDLTQADLVPTKGNPLSAPLRYSKKHIIDDKLEP